MGTYTQDYFGEDAPDQGAGDYAQPRRDYGSRGKITSRPSRDSILQSYAAQDAARARSARMYSQAMSQMYQEKSAQEADRAAQRQQLAQTQREQQAQWEAERSAMERERREQQMAAREARARTRVVPPLTSQESYDRTRSAHDNYERARASRDALSEQRRGRTMNREVIDARGSIDSRAFNETHELVGYSIDDRDKPRAAVDGSFSRTRWHSRAGQGFSNVPDSGSTRPGSTRVAKRGSVGFTGGVMSGRANYTPQKRGPIGLWRSLPGIVKVMIPVIIVLLVALWFVMTH